MFDIKYKGTLCKLFGPVFNLHFHDITHLCMELKKDLVTNLTAGMLRIKSNKLFKQNLL